MTGLWTYPWSLSDPCPETTIEGLADAGIDHLKVAAHYHSVRTFDPKADDLGFDTFPGGCLFDPDETYFERTPIDPPRNESYQHPDAFADIVATANDCGIDVDAWLVCAHGTRLAGAWPEYRIEDAFGTAHDHALCPSHDEVRRYYAGIVRNIAHYDVERVDLESLGFPSVVHGHGDRFGHHKDHVITNRADEFLVSQCFCDGCHREARERGIVDLSAAEAVVSRLCEQYLTTTEPTPSLSELVAEHPELDALFEFRSAVIGDLLATLAAASDDARLSYYLADGGGYAPSSLWPSGVTPGLLGEYVDDVTALCYTDDIDEIDARLTDCEESLDHPIDAGLTLDPSVVEDREQWERLLDRVTERIDGEVFVYNHALLTETQLDWVAPNGVTKLT
ncbi:hypothetical protein [Natronobacterium texcoconense]|uniref:Uncharacterized protein n=1 Tax=Natronobacterium texcoconense TaxID=1095778 RepID=A0A1H1FUE1_NATTX|nr:hypothetical protein [Natronobacterium texcoconense]SDR04632.1 hypothetical protein SAMN04489842_2123 [Natronobacterium texcoconense]